MSSFLRVARSLVSIVILSGFVFLLNSCLNGGEPATDPQLFVINGKEYIPVSLTVTETGSVLEIRMSDDEQEIVIYVEKHGHAPLQTQSHEIKPIDDTGSNVLAIVRNVSGQYFESYKGELRLYNTNGKAAGNFAFEARSGDETITVDNGWFLNQTIISIDSPPCRQTREMGDGTEFADFWYDSKSRLVAINEPYFSDRPSYRFYYFANRLAQVVRSKDAIVENGKVLYNGDDRISQIDFPSREIDFGYDGTGLLTEAAGKCIEYSGENVVRVGCVDGAPSFKYSDFDDKNNAGMLLRESLLGHAAVVYYVTGENGYLLSASNPKIRESRATGESQFVSETITYQQYNVDGYPTAYHIEGPGAMKDASRTYFCE